MESLKVTIINLASITCIGLINSILVAALFNLVVFPNISVIQSFRIDMGPVFFVLMGAWLFFANLAIPLEDYNAVETQEDFDKTFEQELNQVTAHIVTSGLLTITLIALMCFTI